MYAKIQNSPLNYLKSQNYYVFTFKEKQKDYKNKERKHTFTPDCEDPYNMSRSLVFILQATWN